MTREVMSNPVHAELMVYERTGFCCLQVLTVVVDFT